MSILLFCVLLISLQINHGSQSAGLLTAIKNELSNFFNRTAPLLDITIETTSASHKSFFMDILEEILHFQWNFRIQLDFNNVGNPSVGDFNLLFIDSYDAFRRLLPVIENYKGNAPIYFLIVLKPSVIHEDQIFAWMKKIFADLFTLMLDNVNILIGPTLTDPEVHIYTYFPYQPSECRSTKPIRIHRVSNNSLEIDDPPDNQMTFPDKFKNIHGCTLRVVTRNFVFGRKIRRFRGLLEIWGIEYEILNALQAKMNFNVKFIRAIVYDRLEVWPNGTAFGSFKLLKNGKADIMIGFYRHGPVPDLIFSTSVSYFNNWFVIAMFRPPGEFLKFSWLFAPFHPYVWICTVMLLFGAAACIALVSSNPYFVELLELQPNRPKVFNSLVIAIGLGIGHLPKKDFLRVCFIIWSFGLLTIRSVYLGKLFNSYRTMILTTNRLTVTQLLAEHYTIHMQTAYMPLFRNFSGIDTIKYVELTTDRKLNQALTKDSAVIDSFLYFYLTHNETELAELVMEPLFMEHICVFFQSHSSMAQIVDMIILRLIEGGLLLRWKEHFEKLKDISFSPSKFPPVRGPIIVERFKFIMALFSVLYILSGLVFVMEVFWKRIKGFLLRLSGSREHDRNAGAIARSYCYASRLLNRS